MMKYNILEFEDKMNSQGFDVDIIEELPGEYKIVTKKRIEQKILEELQQYFEFDIWIDNRSTDLCVYAFRTAVIHNNINASFVLVSSAYQERRRLW